MPQVEGFTAFLQAKRCGDDYGVDRAGDAFEVVRVEGTTLW